MLERLVAACTAAGDLDRAVAHAQRWQALDPLHEPAYQALIRLLAWTGQRSAALRQYRALVRVLDTELAVRPLPETTRLYDDVRAGRLAPAAGRRPGRPSRPWPRSGRLGRAPRRSLDVRPRRAGGGPPGGRRSPGAPGWPLAGRRTSCSALHAAWREVGAAGQVATVLGAAGLRQDPAAGGVPRRAQAAGGVVLAGRCHDGESELPFVLAADLLRARCRSCPELPARLPAHTAAMAGRLCPELAADYPDDLAPLDSPMALTRLYDGDRGGPADRGAPGPAGPPAGVVVVEDVHWADGPSLDLLAYLVRRLAGWPLLLVLSWPPTTPNGSAGCGPRSARRPTRAGAPSSSRRRCARTRSASLLLRSGVPDADVARLLAQTRGLPMLVREYVEGLRSGAGATAGASAGGRQPRSGNCCAGGCRRPASPPCRCCPPRPCSAAAATRTCCAR